MPDTAKKRKNANGNSHGRLPVVVVSPDVGGVVRARALAKPGSVRATY